VEVLIKTTLGAASSKSAIDAFSLGLRSKPVFSSDTIDLAASSADL